MKILFSMLTLLSITTALNAEAKITTHGRYAVLSGKTRVAPPIAFVDLLIAPPDSTGVWWQLEARATDDPSSEPLYQLQALTSRNPLVHSEQPLEFHSYIVRIGGEALEYRNVHTKKPLLPPWIDVCKYFFPHAAKGSGSKEGLAETCTYLGQVLTLQEVKTNVAFNPFENVKVLDLDPELLIGTSRNMKDTEGRRIPQTTQPQNYTYTPFVQEDYKVMIETGANIFTIAPEQESIVRSEPVFYLRSPDGNPAMRIPADLYRSNYLGCEMFMDEPAVLMVEEEPNVKYRLHPSDAATVLQMRVREHARSDDGAFSLERRLKQQGFNFGDMRLEQSELPVWETIYNTTFYQMSGGGTGLVHEGRYRLEWFDKTVAAEIGVERKHTTEEMLRYYYAYLRGGTWPFGKHWGTAIYGQCDPQIAPVALTLAYDMGARYLWFWTSDHGHHVPWLEQLELIRTVRKHISKHPRGSIFGTRPKRDLALVIPYGTLLSIEDWYGPREAERIGPDLLLRKKLHRAMHAAFDRKDDFDVTVDDGREITGYRQIEHISMDSNDKK